MDPMRLQASSRRWLQTGLAAFVQGDDSSDFAVHHLGVALEHLLKAYLASLHPALVAEANDLDSLLHATGHSDRASRPSTRAKTIGLAAAFKRVKTLLPKQITVKDPEFEPVLAARNGVAHAGHHDTSEVTTALTICIRITDPVLAEMGVAPSAYWGDYIDLRDQLTDEHTTELKTNFAAKMARAKTAYHRWIAGLPSDQQGALVAMLSAANPYSNDYDYQVGCPACEGSGWLHGGTNVNWHAGTDEDGAPLALVTLYPSTYDCAVCGLHLDNDELDLTELPREIELPDEDPYTGYEPDEDLWRDR